MGLVYVHFCIFSSEKENLYHWFTHDWRLATHDSPQSRSARSGFAESLV